MSEENIHLAHGRSDIVRNIRSFGKYRLNVCHHLFGGWVLFVWILCKKMRDCRQSEVRGRYFCQLLRGEQVCCAKLSIRLIVSFRPHLPMVSGFSSSAAHLCPRTILRPCAFRTNSSTILESTCTLRSSRISLNRFFSSSARALYSFWRCT